MLVKSKFRSIPNSLAPLHEVGWSDVGIYRDHIITNPALTVVLTFVRCAASINEKLYLHLQRLLSAPSRFPCSEPYLSPSVRPPCGMIICGNGWQDKRDRCFQKSFESQRITKAVLVKVFCGTLRLASDLKNLAVFRV